VTGEGWGGIGKGGEKRGKRAGEGKGWSEWKSENGGVNGILVEVVNRAAKGNIAVELKWIGSKSSEIKFGYSFRGGSHVVKLKDEKSYGNIVQRHADRTKIPRSKRLFGRFLGYGIDFTS
jgi:hypothetical protein